QVPACRVVAAAQQLHFGVIENLLDAIANSASSLVLRAPDGFEASDDDGGIDFGNQELAELRESVVMEALQPLLARAAALPPFCLVRGDDAPLEARRS